MTPSLTAVNQELQRRLGPIPDLGVFDCRPFRIDGQLRADKGWSEHSWSNAIDYAIRGKAKQKPYVDELKRMRSQGFPVGTIIWAGSRPDHTDHIHVEGSPKFGPKAIPPCKGGASVTGDNDASVKSVNWWDWLINPTEAAVDSFRPIANRIGFGALAIVLIILVVVVMVKAFADSQGVTVGGLLGAVKK